MITTTGIWQVLGGLMLCAVLLSNGSMHGHQSMHRLFSTHNSVHNSEQIGLMVTCLLLILILPHHQHVACIGLCPCLHADYLHVCQQQHSSITMVTTAVCWQCLLAGWCLFLGVFADSLWTWFSPSIPCWLSGTAALPMASGWMWMLIRSLLDHQQHGKSNLLWRWLSSFRNDNNGRCADVVHAAYIRASFKWLWWTCVKSDSIVTTLLDPNTVYR